MFKAIWGFPWKKVWKTVFNFFVSECSAPHEKCSSNWNKWKSVGEYGIISYPYKLIFSCVCFSVCFCIFMLENNSFSFYQSRTLDVMLGLPDQVAGNKHLQWWSLHVPVAHNEQHISYFTRHKAKTFVDRFQILVFALISHFALNAISVS